MSKITAKNLSYNSTLPPFLQRLQSNHESTSSGRHEFSIPRARKPIDEDAERESEPVVFDEASGETISREEWERREKEREDGETKENEGGEGGGEGELEKKENGDGDVGVKVGIGGSRKRKVGKVIGGLEEEEEEKEEGMNNNKSSNKKDTGNQKKNESGKAGAVSKTKPKAAAKKGKKIKLSFGDDE
ncbi:hypothetical protein BCIN_08g05300 [Botrytis cinerea B05.10]|uniref:DUF4604 domain-containing protein n=3 Tax=Botryotinia fuckeliana TaxID=40559 RepID=A0A384JQV4_BOTFB|nr:hypothetical protein BCIN_08g05300 [Botrytis cinerea B05.10]ATZ52913.1 hypothetical protein BCIN_08g05300 [Botrytis cinerea B05.10]EMR85568.1 hypothetical protein BcDW1_5808 [Botrytis cinerea BcDW1]CCD42481.1 hypothetical protein BofuT4_P075640.1 [Botrytis cinerea T4]